MFTKLVYITSEDRYYMDNYYSKIYNDLCAIYGNVEWFDYNGVELCDFENDLYTFPITLYISNTEADTIINNRIYKVQNHYSLS